MSLVNVGHLMASPRFMRDISLRRPTVAIADDGSATTSYAAAVTIQASPQPATARETEQAQTAMAAAGERGSGRVIKIYSATELKMSDGKTDLSDIVIVDGDSFRVVATEPWGAHGYYKVLAVEWTP